MKQPEHVRVEPPELFDLFRDRRTGGQRKRALMHRVYSTIAAVQRRVRR